jgi:hypothetical protein
MHDASFNVSVLLSCLICFHVTGSGQNFENSDWKVSETMSRCDNVQLIDNESTAKMHVKGNIIHVPNFYGNLVGELPNRGVFSTHDFWTAKSQAGKGYLKL